MNTKDRDSHRESRHEIEISSKLVFLMDYKLSGTHRQPQSFPLNFGFPMMGDENASIIRD